MSLRHDKQGALPVFGGRVVALVTILVVPTCYCAIKQAKWKLDIPNLDFATKKATE